MGEYIFKAHLEAFIKSVRDACIKRALNETFGAPRTGASTPTDTSSLLPLHFGLPYSGVADSEVAYWLEGANWGHKAGGAWGGAVPHPENF